MAIWAPLDCIWETDTNGNAARLKRKIGPWKRVQNEEFEKIDALSGEQIFDYTKQVVRRPVEIFRMDHYHVYISPIFFGSTGPDAAAEYKNTMISILMKLKNRFQRELTIFDDIKNVRKVMVSEISIPDHTALFCVHKHMVRKSQMINVPRIQKYIAAIAKFTSRLESSLESNHQRYYDRQQRLQAVERAEALRKEREAQKKRKRRAPERLNIATTKSKSYY